MVLFLSGKHHATRTLLQLRKILYIGVVFVLAACRFNSTTTVDKMVTELTPEEELVLMAPDPIPATVEYVYHLKGSINEKYGVIMRLSTDDNRLSGQYKYTKQKGWINLNGTLDGNKIRLEQWIQDKDTSLLIESFDGILSATAITGNWASANKEKSFPFVLTPYHGTQLTSDYIFITNSVYDEYSGYWLITEIKVYNQKGNLSQVIDQFEARPMQNQLHLEDLNFDGYWDLHLIDTVRKDTETPHWYWIYQPASHEFVRDTSLSVQAMKEFDFIKPRT